MPCFLNNTGKDLKYCQYTMTPLQAQRHTIYCLLSCVNTVTSVCPHREEAVLLRLLQTLTRVRLEYIFMRESVFV